MADGLYVHVPFCDRRCGYCDFYTVVGSEDSKRALVDALLMELSGVTGPVETVFVGGGTPSALGVDAFADLFNALGRIGWGSTLSEFTVEVNPASLTDEKAAILRANGVNRISMGAQSFDDDELRLLERLHSASEVAPSAEIVRRHGFEHFSLDLMFGIPGQTLDTWRASLDAAIALGVDHLSCYGLTYEQGTPFYRRRERGALRPADEDLEAAMYEFTMDHLASAGLRQYEISNYAKRGCESRHNLRYWHNESVIGIGPAAASYQNGHRWRNVPNTARYVECIRAGRSPAIEEEQLSPLERAGETAMLALRLNEGIDRRRFQRATGFDPTALFAETIRQHRSNGTIEIDDDAIRLTRAGRLIADTVIADFLSPTESLQSR